MWILILALASIAGLIITSQIVRADSADTKDNITVIEMTNTNQTDQQLREYWTPERMQNAQPLMPTVDKIPTSETGTSSNSQPPSNRGNNGSGSEPTQPIEPKQK